MVSTFLPITNKSAWSLEFRMNDYLALLVTLLIKWFHHLNKILLIMLVCLRSWSSDEISVEKALVLFTALTEF